MPKQHRRNDLRKFTTGYAAYPGVNKGGIAWVTTEFYSNDLEFVLGLVNVLRCAAGSVGTVLPDDAIGIEEIDNDCNKGMTIVSAWVKSKPENFDLLNKPATF